MTSSWSRDQRIRSKDHLTLMMGASHQKPASTMTIWSLWVFCRWRYNILHLICHVSLHDHLTEGSCKFMGGSSLQYVTTLISLASLSNVMVVNTCLECYINLWVEAPHGESPPCHLWYSLV